MSVAALFACLLSLCQPPAPAASEDGYVPLFNGKDLTGWEPSGKAEVWTVEDGMIVVKGGGGGWLFTKDTYENFDLTLDFKLPEMGNSGVALRAPRKKGDPAYQGMEIQLLDDRNYLDESKYKGLQQWQRTGSIYGVVPPSKDATKPAGEWNTMRIVAQGPKIKIILNGETIVDANLEDHKDRAEAHEGKPAHPGILRTHGHLGLQSHDGRVEFKNIKIKKLEKQSAPAN